MPLEEKCESLDMSFLLKNVTIGNCSHVFSILDTLISHIKAEKDIEVLFLK